MEAGVKRYKSLKICRLSKEEIENMIDLNNLFTDVIYYFEEHEDYVKLILSAKADREENAKRLLREAKKKGKKVFGEYLYVVDSGDSIEAELVKKLEEKELTICTAESCTGGLVASKIISISGASEVFKEGFVTYTNKSKRRTLNVKAETLRNYGAVSRQTAKEMAAGAMLSGDSDVAISITGIAGPDGGSVEKPVGLVYIACCYDDGIEVEKYTFSGSRNEVREQAANAALKLALECISK